MPEQMRLRVVVAVALFAFTGRWCVPRTVQEKAKEYGMTQYEVEAVVLYLVAVFCVFVCHSPMHVEPLMVCFSCAVRAAVVSGTLQRFTNQWRHT